MRKEKNYNKCDSCGRYFKIHDTQFSWQINYCCEECWLDSEEYTIGVILIAKLIKMMPDDRETLLSFYETLIQILSSDNYLAMLSGIVSELYETEIMKRIRQ